MTSIETGDPPTTVKASGGTDAPANKPTQDELERQFAISFPGMIAYLPGINEESRDIALWNFDVGSADLDKFEDVLKNFGSFFQDWKDRGFSVDIVGVASVSGAAPLNADLAFARGMAVQKMYEQRFQMPEARLNVRQVGARADMPPPDVLETFTNDEMTWRAWNRRVELRAVGEPWTDGTWNRIITYLGTPAASVANDTERQRAINLAKLLKESVQGRPVLLQLPEPDERHPHLVDDAAARGQHDAEPVAPRPEQMGSVLVRRSHAVDPGEAASAHGVGRAARRPSGRGASQHATGRWRPPEVPQLAGRWIRRRGPGGLRGRGQLAPRTSSERRQRVFGPQIEPVLCSGEAAGGQRCSIMTSPRPELRARIGVATYDLGTWPELAFADRVIATLVVLRFQLPHAALAVFYRVNRSIVTRPVGEVRPLVVRPRVRRARHARPAACRTGR